MSEADFFRRIGIFSLKNFLHEDLCQEIASEMDLATSSSPAEVTRDGVDEVNEGIRRTNNIQISQQKEKLIQSYLTSKKQHFETHFGTTLGSCEIPQFLVYKEGDFFKIHTDSSASPTSHKHVQQRRVSVVLFVNSRSSTPNPNTYSGGSLVLYGLIKQPQWENYGFHIKGEAGLLIAFSSDILHEVTPVTQGKRFSIVTWFPSSGNISNPIAGC